ncbi:hypothetical protein SBA3_3300014 [Candidatus Sulfopaludibacter sp. SbA3]|nr:hypothetical protein SBA3_3300014 [Candidatus Sulfopaludibacter sp. SbA3]
MLPVRLVPAPTRPPVAAPPEEPTLAVLLPPVLPLLPEPEVDMLPGPLTAVTTLASAALDTCALYAPIRYVLLHPLIANEGRGRPNPHNRSPPLNESF